MRDEIIEAIHTAAAQLRNDSDFAAFRGDLFATLDTADKEAAASLWIYAKYRAETSRLRRIVERGYDQMMDDATDEDQRVAARITIARERFYCFITGEWVEFGAATAEQHEARAGVYGSRIAGLAAARDRHIEAARAIKDAGVACVNDLVLEGAAA
jgi:hypothetical protein